jgi:hypothetical protein
MELFKLYYRQRDNSFIMPYRYKSEWIHYFDLVKKNEKWFEININYASTELFKSVPKEFEVVSDPSVHRFIIENLFFKIDFRYKL